jgi:hypothetical protein
MQRELESLFQDLLLRYKYCTMSILRLAETAVDSKP